MTYIASALTDTTNQTTTPTEIAPKNTTSNGNTYIYDLLYKYLRKNNCAIIYIYIYIYITYF